ncbi:MAG: peroxide stress protein YaaA, partial [Peptostreptococcaceae bacterium]
IDFKYLSQNFNIINIEFKDYRENTNTYKVIGLYSKKARGYLTRYIIKNKINSPNELKNFNYDGYTFNINLSDSNNFIFSR